MGTLELRAGYTVQHLGFVTTQRKFKFVTCSTVLQRLNNSSLKRLAVTEKLTNVVSKVFCKSP